ncbi:MAG: phosphatidylserine decarboxylase [Acidobacteria bacterium]|jgi:phosphatidylserine decarboxylase|nr:phosphatidylserine decarboxylase [Acidobacteriota bacterium]
MTSPAETTPEAAVTTPRRRIRIDRAGVPFVAVPLGAALAAAVAGSPWSWFALPAAALGLFSAWFFRDPDREIPQDPSLVLSPADGRVTAVDEGAGGLVVTIFLNVFNVHVNRVPVAGTVRSVTHRPGRFLAAYRPEATEVNERTDLVLETARGPVAVAQIAGLIARRIVVRVVPGERLAAGARYGLIRFGSCTQVALPPGAEPLVRPGEAVRGGTSVLARWRDAAPGAP